ncbi:MAG: LPS export ABC transporter permease LptF [Pseudomonadota bacterium]
MLNRLDRYLTREALGSMLAVSGVLWVAMMANVGVQLFGTVMAGAIPADILPGLMWANAVKLMLFILPAGGFLGLLLALGRMYRDQEIPVLLACGASPLRLQRPVVRLALVWALLIAFLSLHYWPAVQTARDTMLQQARSASVYKQLPVGRFLVADEGRVTVYAARLGMDGRTLEDVFVHTRQPGSEGVERARQAWFEEDGQGVRQLVLRDGRRHEGLIGQADWRVLEFAEHRIDLGLERASDAAQRKRSSAATLDLWRDGSREAMSELVRRASQALSVLMLALLALPLARSAPRQGRFARLGVGILLYISYFNLISMTVRMVQDGRLSPLAGLAAPHLLLLVVVLLLLWRQGAFVRIDQGDAREA